MTQDHMTVKIATGIVGVAMMLIVSLLPGCLNVGFDKKASETTLRQEVAILVKQYRLCLLKYEDEPAKARERCGVYREAIKDLGPEAQRSVVAELIDRLEVKVKD